MATRVNLYFEDESQKKQLERDPLPVHHQQQLRHHVLGQTTRNVTNTCVSALLKDQTLRREVDINATIHEDILGIIVDPLSVSDFLRENKFRIFI